MRTRLVQDGRQFSAMYTAGNLPHSALAEDGLDLPGHT